MSDDRAARHREAAVTHDAAADRHEEAAAFWEGEGDSELAELERRNAHIERDAAGWSETAQPSWLSEATSST